MKMRTTTRKFTRKMEVVGSSKKIRRKNKRIKRIFKRNKKEPNRNAKLEEGDYGQRR